MSVALEATGLTKRYGRTVALSEANLAVPAGRVVALVGPNGAGKTTLMQLAVGLLEPTAGQIRVFGVTPRRQDTAALARVGFLAQDRPLYRGFTVEEMLGFAAHTNPRFDILAARTRLGDLEVPLRRKVRKLSGGQQAQVALTLALAKQPDLLVLDEPVSGLDPLARQEFTRSLLREAAERQLTVIVSSHVVAELERFCDYLILLHQGVVQVAGDVDTLLQQHRRVTVDPVDEAALVAHPGAFDVRPGPRQTRAMLRLDQPPVNPLTLLPGIRLQATDVTLEDLVLAYMADPHAGHLPGPTVAVAR
jgi:ABC-2 type transport system ATP-binding protein